MTKQGSCARFLIQWDNVSKRMPYRVVTNSGTCIAYFKTFGDAARFCEVTP